MTMTRDKIEELKRLAEKATQGEWRQCGGMTPAYRAITSPSGYVVFGMADSTVHTEHGNAINSPNFDEQDANARYIAAANPQTILSLLALAERALEPQGQALPELPEPFDRLVGHPAEGAPVFTADQMHSYARAYASQLALPAGPLPDLGDIVEPLRQRFLKLKRNSFILSAHGVKRVDDSTGQWVDWDEVHALLDPTAIEAASHSPAVAQPEPVIKQSLTTAVAQPVADELSAAARDVLAERRRQQEVEGWTPERDDRYSSCELARAAATYALCTRPDELRIYDVVAWPWPIHWWKSTTYRRNLEKAGALIIAEIERIDRAALGQPAEEGDKA